MLNQNLVDFEYYIQIKWDVISDMRTWLNISMYQNKKNQLKKIKLYGICYNSYEDLIIVNQQPMLTLSSCWLMMSFFCQFKRKWHHWSFCFNVITWTTKKHWCVVKSHTKNHYKQVELLKIEPIIRLQTFKKLNNMLFKFLHFYEMCCTTRLLHLI